MAYIPLPESSGSAGPQIRTLRRPDDWHVHFRDGEMMRAVLPYTAKMFGRAIVMPNLTPPVVTAEAALMYRNRILQRVPRGVDFTPLMTCYLTDTTQPEEVEYGHKEKIWIATKLYPAHATTHSAHGVTDINKVMPVLERMAAIGMPLLIHGEVTDPEVDIFDREAAFIERVLHPLRVRLPELRIVLEHVTTAEAVLYVQYERNTAATITPHHLVINRNDIFKGGIRPHLYCLPIAKREKHRQALRRAATSGLPCFFLGTDSAPHEISTKHAECGCAGIFCAPTALETYVEVFEEEGKLENLESFASLNGPAFYNLPPNEERITLIREEWTAPEEVVVCEHPDKQMFTGSARFYMRDPSVRIFRGGETLRWKLAA